MTGGLLFEKQYSIHNDRVQHIYTSKERAQIIDDLLVGIKPYIKENDYLFAYGSLPAINYMTRTKPFAGCSWPELLSVQLLKEKLNNYIGPLPIILRQKFNSIGMEFGEPSNTYLTDCGLEVGHFRSNQKSRIMTDFVLKNKYKTAFENNYFILYLPPKNRKNTRCGLISSLFSYKIHRNMLPLSIPIIKTLYYEADFN